MILFINACARSESRTKRLADALLRRLTGEIKEIRLKSEDLPCLEDEKILARRTEACAQGRTDDPLLAYAREFASADTVVIAAPFWDLSFPAVLKKYLECVSAVGVTCRYTPEGVPVGLCREKKLYYVTTAGGEIFDAGFGYGYVKALATGMFGIPECAFIKAERLDIDPARAEEILREAMEKIEV